MDNELLALMTLLSKKTYLSLTELESDAMATRRQITYRLDKLNNLLKEANITPVIYGKEIQLSAKTKEAIQGMVKNFSHDHTYFLKKEERLIYLFLMLFINPGYLSLNHFIDALKISRSTVLLDLKDLEAELKEYHIEIRNNRTKGYYLRGAEFEIRRCMMRHVIYMLSEEHNGLLFDAFIDDFNLDIFDYSRLVILELAKRHNIRFVEDRLTEFIYIFIFLKRRMLSGISVTEEIEEYMNMDMMRTMKEYQFTTDLLNNYKNTDCIPQADINYISAWILGISFGDIDEDTKDCITISDIISKIMVRFELLSGTHYKDTSDIFIQLYGHIRPAYYRLLFKLPIFNPLAQKVKNEYSKLYHLVEETMKPLAPIFGQDIPEEELAYLTMHFAAIYTGNGTVNKDSLKTALVVCSNGIGSSAILYSELVGLFPEMRFLPPADSSGIRNIDEKIDIIFATSAIDFEEDIKIPIVRVSPVMTTQERYQTVREVYLQLGAIYSKQPDVEKVMEIVSHHASVNDERGLYHELVAYFSGIKMKKEIESDIHLLDMVSEKLIQLNLEASSWEEAIRLSFAPLLDQKLVTMEYVDEAVRGVKRVGPYIVITKHVALPHAKADAGALGCGMGITVLKNPIVFNNPANDPVKYIFPLSANDNQAHLAAMSELLEYFVDEKFYEILDKAEKPSEIIDYLEKNKNV